MVNWATSPWLAWIPVGSKEKDGGVPVCGSGGWTCSWTSRAGLILAGIRSAFDAA
ncbi:MAG: hypothetical protein ABEJ31_05395 [Haloarculaceae archaeon]